MRTGNIVCFAYNLLERADFDASGAIMLQFAGAVIRIMGQCLNTETRPGIRLFTGITEHRVKWIQESEFNDDAEPQEGVTVVDEIVI